MADAYREINGSCICTNYVTYTPEASELSHACGTLYFCSRDGYVATSVSTSGNAGYATYQDMGSGSMKLLGYVRRADLFMDDSGTFEHMYNCTYKSY